MDAAGEHELESLLIWGLEQIIENSEGDISHVLLAGYGVGLSWAGCMVDLSYAKKR